MGRGAGMGEQIICDRIDRKVERGVSVRHDLNEMELIVILGASRLSHEDTCLPP
jgi:hypothetical protein